MNKSEPMDLTQYAGGDWFCVLSTEANPWNKDRCENNQTLKGILLKIGGFLSFEDAQRYVDTLAVYAKKCRCIDKNNDVRFYPVVQAFLFGGVTYSSCTHLGPELPFISIPVSSCMLEVE